MWRLRLLAFALLPALAPTGAGAGWYAGARAGSVDIDVQDNINTVQQAPVVVSGFAGWDHEFSRGHLGAEVEWVETAAKGLNVADNDITASVQGAFLVFRSTGPFYFKAKWGKVSVDLDNPGQPDYADDATRSSIGVGFGIGSPRLQFEIDHTRLSDFSDYISMGLRWRFGATSAQAAPAQPVDPRPIPVDIDDVLEDDVPPPADAPASAPVAPAAPPAPDLDALLDAAPEPIVVEPLPGPDQ